MKKIMFCVVVTLVALASSGQSIHGLSITNIDGGTIPLSTYQGKKLLILIAPTSKYDTAVVEEIAAFQSRYGDTVKLIGVMSNEDGYLDSNKTGIKNLFQSMGVNIVLAAPANTRSEAGTNQGYLMKWLTHVSLNKRYNADVMGIGQKFFIDESGKLYSVLIPSVPLLSPFVITNIERKPAL